MSDPIEIHTEGVKELVTNFDKYPGTIRLYLSQAGNESANRVILKTKGVQKYPPATSANQPPTPYYIRGRGTQTKTRNYGNSERLGTQWRVKTVGYGTEIANRSSYAKWAHGDAQARAMARIGWRKLEEVAVEKIGQIRKIYEAWVAKALHDIGLRK